MDLKKLPNNHAAVDLGDAAKDVCVQVSAQRGAAKVGKTLEKFIDGKLYDKYPRLVVLVTMEKTDHRKAFETKGLFNFDIADDILDCDDLLADIEKMDVKQMEALKKLVAREMKPLLSSVAAPSSIFAGAEQVISMPPKTANAFRKFLKCDPDDELWEEEFERIQDAV
ncbi:MAG: SMEK domain-containing protein [Usitatibacteraceae bacterium]